MNFSDHTKLHINTPKNYLVFVNAENDMLDFNLESFFAAARVQRYCMLHL